MLAIKVQDDVTSLAPKKGKLTESPHLADKDMRRLGYPITLHRGGMVLRMLAIREGYPPREICT